MQRSQMRLEGISEGIHLDIGTLKRGGSVARIKFRRREVWDKVRQIESLVSHWVIVTFKYEGDPVGNDMA